MIIGNVQRLRWKTVCATMLLTVSSNMLVAFPVSLGRAHSMLTAEAGTNWLQQLAWTVAATLLAFSGSLFVVWKWAETKHLGPVWPTTAICYWLLFATGHVLTMLFLLWASVGLTPLPWSRLVLLDFGWKNMRPVVFAAALGTGWVVASLPLSRFASPIVGKIDYTMLRSLLGELRNRWHNARRQYSTADRELKESVLLELSAILGRIDVECKALAPLERNGAEKQRLELLSQAATEVAIFVDTIREEGILEEGAFLLECEEAGLLLRSHLDSIRLLLGRV